MHVHAFRMGDTCALIIAEVIIEKRPYGQSLLNPYDYRSREYQEAARALPEATDSVNPKIVVISRPLTNNIGILRPNAGLR